MKPRTKNAKMQTQKQAEQTAAQPTPDQIRQRAQEIFEARGHIPGRELDDWLQAEKELKSGIGLRTEKPAH